MPGEPIEMPSDTVMVLNSTPLPPAPSAPRTASPASSLMCTLQGVRFAQVEATPICGLPKSASWKPTARNIARDGVCFAPSTTTRKAFRSSTFFFVIVRPSNNPSRILRRVHHATHVREPRRADGHEYQWQRQRIHAGAWPRSFQPLVDQDAGRWTDRAAHARKRDVYAHVVLRATHRSEVI